MSASAVIVFVKEPEAGKVKTRLAADVGHEKALEVYERLLAHTDSQSAHQNRFIFFSGNPDGINHFQGKDEWIAQSAGDLGERIAHAFSIVFSKGYSKVLIIGSDCPDLTTEIIDKALASLDENSACLGPAEDGGYYLLGLTKPMPELFTNMPWSTDEVAAITISRLDEQDLTLLPTLRDIDTVADLKAVGWE